jgi:hypothetical protein
MPTLVYSIKSSKNSGLPISAPELANRYFFGIPIVDQSGNIMRDEDIEFFIKTAKEDLEGYLNLKLSKQIIEESFDYYRDDYKYWGYVPVSYPCVKPFKLYGLLGDIEQIEFPSNWLSPKRTNDGIGYGRDIKLVPTAGSVMNQSTVYSGITPNVGWWGQKSIPNYWTAIYCTSMDRVPEDILDAIGKLASINVFHQLGDIILGAGIASQSIGIDGLSQSISTTSSATNAGYGARITGYLADLKKMMPRLKQKYDGFELMSM